MYILKRIILLFTFSLTMCTAVAQYYSGEHTFDGENRNEASMSVTTGKNVITGPCIGNTLHYKHYFNNHWSVDGGINAQYTKQLYGIKAKGEYHIQVNAFHIFASAEMLYNRYFKYKTNEIDGNISVRFERGYWDITLGESLISSTSPFSST